MKLSKSSIIVIAICVICIAIASFLFIKKGNSSQGEPTVQPGETNATDYFSVSTTNLVIPVGSTATFDITLKNAVGRIDVIPADSQVVSANEENVWIESIDKDTPDTANIMVTGLKEGNTQIVVSLNDVASFDKEEQLSGSFTINVTVE